MDNLTHTLVGATMGRAGLARGSALAMPALLIGANIPDLDALGLFFGYNLGFRRGITHGVLALALWPFLLTGFLLLWDRWRRRRQPGRPAVQPRVLLVAATAGVLSHPLLDWFNSYGMRWLMPFRDTWYYGDTWFIIDPWVMVVLLGALWFAAPRAGRPARPGPARAGLVLVAGYAALMWSGSWLGHRAVLRQLSELGFARPAQVMVAPVAFNPFHRDVLIEDGDLYRSARLVPGRALVLAPESVIEKGLHDVNLRAVAADREGAQFLRWSRFPFARTTRVGDTTVVILDDARYAGREGRSFARTVVRLLPP